MRLTGESQVSVDVAVNRQCVAVSGSDPENVISDVITQAPWSVVYPRGLCGQEIGQKLTVPVQHLYCVGDTINHQDV